MAGIAARRRLITEVPADRWDADEYLRPRAGRARSVGVAVGWVHRRRRGFDPEFFGISEREAIAMDPQHRLLLETSWEAWNTPAWRRRRWPARGRVCSWVWPMVTTRLSPAKPTRWRPVRFYRATASAWRSGRVSYAMGLRGPAMTVDTACSSSLLAVHLACRSLHRRRERPRLGGRCALVAGTEDSSLPGRRWECCLRPAAATRSTSRPTGSFRSEGCAVLLLKRLPDAQADGDRILAVLRGTATNQDGRTGTLRRLRRSAQVEAYRTALAAGALRRRHVGMVEAHGHRHPGWRPIEFASLARFTAPTALARSASVEEQFRAYRVGCRGAGTGQGDPGAAARCCPTACCISPGCPTSSPRSRPISLCRSKITPWPDQDGTRRRGGRRCRRTGCRAPTCTRFSSRPPSPRDRGTTAGDVPGQSASVVVCAVVHFRRRAAPDRPAAGRLD